MAARNGLRRFGNVVTPALIAAALATAAALTPAAAASQPYLGWDFGGGFGIGLGPPPSAYDPCPTYGWPVYPYRCGYAYHGPRRAYYRRHRARYSAAPR